MKAHADAVNHCVADLIRLELAAIDTCLCYTVRQHTVAFCWQDAAQVE